MWQCKGRAFVRKIDHKLHALLWQNRSHIQAIKCPSGHFEKGFTGWRAVISNVFKGINNIQLWRTVPDSGFCISYGTFNMLNELNVVISILVCLYCYSYNVKTNIYSYSLEYYLCIQWLALPNSVTKCATRLRNSVETLNQQCFACIDGIGIDHRYKK